MISTAEYQARRQQLLSRLPADSVAVLPAASHSLRNSDVEYRFRQDSDFRYLCGFPEADAIAVLDNRPDQPSFTLYCLEKNPEMELWTGRRAGPEGAMADYAADAAYRLSELDEALPKQLDGAAQLVYPMGRNAAFEQRLNACLKTLRGQVRLGRRAPTALLNLDDYLHEQRLIKSPAELAAMREAGRISAQAHCRAMQTCAPGVMEYQLAAEIEHEFHYHGGDVAYGSIVGGGANACILHYTENNAALRDGDLVLIDAGGEFAGYGADITRSFPVNGRFSSAQQALYEVVLAAQLAAIDCVRAGRSYNDYHAAAVQVLSQGLLDLGLLHGELNEAIATEAYKPFYMHKTGHWLGMDVHDVGAYKTATSGRLDWRPLEAGMVLTVEPGLYVAAGSDCDERWWDIGIRIEDDVCVTNAEPEVFTTGVPKTVAEIEALMAENRSAAASKP